MSDDKLVATSGDLIEAWKEGAIHVCGTLENKLAAIAANHPESPEVAEVVGVVAEAMRAVRLGIEKTK